MLIMFFSELEREVYREITQGYDLPTRIRWHILPIKEDIICDNSEGIISSYVI
jgi:hypothetical protein